MFDLGFLDLSSPMKSPYFLQAQPLLTSGQTENATFMQVV